ncbi:Hypothetical protein FKW44_004625 [Caligus rogercresseyi]|uniref:Uncharacterized protein n=1 Tax=Caligus rogercresseyi TaxID=217165 RepID=A0A7T8HM62_CALRO|nr:Hypothetical protein FKW44_004625 [Caligus rogercresseyi]
MFMSRVSARSDHIDKELPNVSSPPPIIEEENETRRGQYNDWNHAPVHSHSRNLIPSNDESM